MSATGYSDTQKALHWAIVVLVGLQFLLSGGIEDAYAARAEGRDAARGVLASLHVFLGTAIFVIMAIRAAIRRAEGVPVPAAPGRSLAGVVPAHVLSRVALAVHWAFYALLLSLPVLGALAWFQSNAGAGDLHEAGTTLLLILVGLHAAAAVAHHVIERGDALRRMLP